jgi:transposase-like protein
MQKSALSRTFATKPYRAVDEEGNTIKFMLSAKREVSAAKRFLRKIMRAEHWRLPFTIGTDKHASYPEAFSTSVKENVLPLTASCGASGTSTTSASRAIARSVGSGERCNACARSGN